MSRQDKLGRYFTNHIEKVYNENFEKLYAYALVITKSENIAKDVVSDVFYGILKSQKDLNSVKKLQSYLFTSVKNQAVRALSIDPLSFNSQDQEYIALTTDDVDPEDLMIGSELEDFLNNSINDLPPQCGLVFRLMKQQNLNYIEVANELDISVDTVKYHMKTALKRIRVALNEHFDSDTKVRWMTGGVLVFLISELLFQYL